MTLTLAPTSPIWSTVETIGSLNGSGVIQLSNVSNSRVTLVVYGIYVSGALSGTDPLGNPSAVYVRRTTTPLTLGGGASVQTALLQHLNEWDSSVITGTLRGFDFSFNGVVFDKTDAEWYGLPGTDSSSGWQPTPVLREDAFWRFPWSVQPGSALEICTGTRGVGNSIRGTLVWDEL